MRTDTIAAIATAPGQGGVGIVRLSGPMSGEILRRVFTPAGGQGALPSHRMTYGHVTENGERVDECMAVLMKAPRSYTREDVAELQVHGSPSLCRKVLELCLSAGARLAEPGEFTRRAFLNGRIDLSQAEAVMAMIASTGEQSRRAAMRQLEGGAGQFIREAQETLYTLQAGAAACIDYPEEITEEEAAADLAPQLCRLAERLESACDERAARLVTDGLRVALVGRPNVGKSSLLNALLGEERAIVTAIPGTTRDTVEGSLSLGGATIRLTDTAGLRETADPVEAIGVERSGRAMREADLVLCVLDASAPLTEEDRAILNTLEPDKAVLVLNKCDRPALLEENALPHCERLRVSAVT